MAYKGATFVKNPYWDVDGQKHRTLFYREWRGIVYFMP